MRKIYCDWCNKEIKEPNINPIPYLYKIEFREGNYELCDECDDKYGMVWNDLTEFEVNEQSRYEKELEEKRKAKLKEVFDKYDINGGGIDG